MPIAFDSDCREGICGIVQPGGQRRAARARSRHAPSASCTCAGSRTATRSPIEPWRAKAFPVVKDLVVDRSAFDRIIAAGGYVSVNAGGAPDGNAIPIPKDVVETRDGRGRVHRLRRVRRRVQERVGAPVHGREDLAPRRCCRRASRSATSRVVAMVEQTDAEGFGSCTNEGECEAVCPKEIPISNIARMNRDYVKAAVSGAR